MPLADRIRRWSRSEVDVPPEGIISATLDEELVAKDAMAGATDAQSQPPPGSPAANRQDSLKQQQSSSVPSSTPSARPAAVLDSAIPCSPLSYSARHTAFLLLDLHVILCERLNLGPESEVITAAANMRKWALAQGITVVHGLIDFSEPCRSNAKSATIIDATLQQVREDENLGNEHDSVALSEHEARHGGGKEHVFHRSPGTVSVLMSSGLRDFLHYKSIRSVVLAGLSTSGCVLSSSRSLSDAGFVTTILTDAIADPRQDVHDTLVKHVLPAQSHVTTSEEFIATWRQSMVR